MYNSDFPWSSIREFDLIFRSYYMSVALLLHLWYDAFATPDLKGSPSTNTKHIKILHMWYVYVYNVSRYNWYATAYNRRARNWSSQDPECSLEMKPSKNLPPSQLSNGGFSRSNVARRAPVWWPTLKSLEWKTRWLTLPGICWKIPNKQCFPWLVSQRGNQNTTHSKSRLRWLQG